MSDASLTDSGTPGPASDADIARLLQQLAGNGDGDLVAIDAMLGRHPDDARLHFLRGSVLAGTGRALEAHTSLSRALQIAPDFIIARFQLGFFELTSGEPNLALENWAPLDDLPDEHYLRLFVAGLRALIADDFATCIARLEQGIAVNVENPPLNNDMQLIIDQCRAINGDVPPANSAAAANVAVDDDVSATALLLNRFGPSGSRH